MQTLGLAFAQWVESKAIRTAALLAIELRPPVALLIAKASSDLVFAVFGSKVESNRVSFNGNLIVKW